MRLPEHQFTFTLIAVGRLEPEKRIEDILAALKLVAKQYPMVGLFIVGEGSERGRLERMARHLGLGDKVIFLGERPDVRALIASAQAFIQASAYEGYSRTLIEAALAKVPIITTDVGIVGEVFKGYEDFTNDANVSRDNRDLSERRLNQRPTVTLIGTRLNECLRARYERSHVRPLSEKYNLVPETEVARHPLQPSTFAPLADYKKPHHRILLGDKLKRGKNVFNALLRLQTPDRDECESELVFGQAHKSWYGYINGYRYY